MTAISKLANTLRFPHSQETDDLINNPGALSIHPYDRAKAYTENLFRHSKSVTPTNKTPIGIRALRPIKIHASDHQRNAGPDRSNILPLPIRIPPKILDRIHNHDSSRNPERVRAPLVLPATLPQVLPPNPPFPFRLKILQPLEARRASSDPSRQ